MSSDEESYVSTGYMSTDEVTVKRSEGARRKRKAGEKDSSEDRLKIKKGESSRRNEEERRRSTRRMATDTEESEGRREMKRIEEGIRKKDEREERLRKEKAEKRREKEEIKRKEVEKREREDNKNKSETIWDRRIDKIQGELRKIQEAVSKENGGKISMTRMDQVAVKDAIIAIQEEIVLAMKGQLQLEREGRQNMEVEGVKEKKESGRQLNTYTKVTRGGRSSESEQERIEGRVVRTGREGWVTPPLRKEKPIVVSKNNENDGRKLATQIASTIKAKDIGGPPRSVRVAREGKVIIIPENDSQKDRIIQNLGKIEQVEAREVKGGEPLLIITGVERGQEERELIEKIRRGSEGVASLGDDLKNFKKNDV